MDICKKQLAPRYPGGNFVGLGGQKCKSLENLPNGWTDWHQICYTSADSSGNGHRLKQLSPRYPRGHFGGFRGSQNAKVWKIYQTAGLIGTKCGNHLQIHLGMDICKKQLAPRYPGGNFVGLGGGSKMQKSGKSTKRLDRLAPNLVHVCGFIWEWT